MGQKVRNLLDSKKISQKVLADKMDVKKQYVSELLKKPTISLNAATKIAKALDMDVETLWQTLSSKESENIPELSIVKEDREPYGNTKPQSYFLEMYKEYMGLISENSRLKSLVIELQKENNKLKA